MYIDGYKGDGMLKNYHKKLPQFAIAMLFIMVFGACSASSNIPPQITAPPSDMGVESSPTPQNVATATSVQDFKPYPYTTPLPPPTPTELDGLYTRDVKFEGTPTPCRRCAPYRAEGGTWTLRLDAGVYRVSHSDTGFQGVGSFTVSDNQIILFNDPNCHLGIGSYTWKLDEQLLILDVLDDECAFGLRLNNLTAGGWVKQNNTEGYRDQCQPPSLEAAITGHWPIPDNCQLSTVANVLTK